MGASATFVVRVWAPAAAGDAETDPVIRGDVEHVASGQASAFATEEHLLAFIRATRGLGRAAPVERDTRPVVAAGSAPLAPEETER
ncbi:MAG: hypothetical protein A2X23_12415 [Chloroflexi bacterium GWC2_73_18]|nr:MAG: hypothetical protein A2X23_12415 [Chloroflexi bacterium GWC2_73_18]